MAKIEVFVNINVRRFSANYVEEKTPQNKTAFLALSRVCCPQAATPRLLCIWMS